MVRKIRRLERKVIHRGEALTVEDLSKLSRVELVNLAHLLARKYIEAAFLPLEG